MSNVEVKDIFIENGFFDQIPININAILSNSERDLFVYLRRMNKMMPNKYISWYEFSVNCSLSKPTVLNALNSLKRLELISIKDSNNNGTLYSLNSSLIKDILDKLNNTHDLKERYLIGNEFRISKGLKSINEATIKLLDCHKNIILKDDERGINIKERSPTKKIESNNKNLSDLQKQINRANSLYKDLENREIDLNYYNNQINIIKKITKEKITFNKELKTWKTIK